MIKQLACYQGANPLLPEIAISPNSFLLGSHNPNKRTLAIKFSKTNDPIS